MLPFPQNGSIGDWVLADGGSCAARDAVRFTGSAYEAQAGRTAPGAPPPRR
jgi:hypothetical protein